jgi:hypothetical protein
VDYAWRCGSAFRETIKVQKKNLSEARLLIVIAFTYLLYLIYLTVGLGFQMLRGDMLGYWQESLRWTTPFSTWWAPGYPLLIAAVRGISLNIFPPIGVMVLISAVTYLLAVIALYRFANHRQFSYPVYPTLLFAFAPFVGLTYAVYPYADSTAIALFLLSVLSLEKLQWGRFILFSGASMVFHKVMWLFIPSLMLVAFFKQKESRWRLLLAFIPLLIWGITGMFYHHDLLWFMRWSVENLIVSQTSLPIFDGLITPLLSGSAIRSGKGVVVALVCVLALICTYYSYQHRLWLALSISLPFLFIVTFVNSYEIWIAVRYSKLLVIPLSIIYIQVGLHPSIITNRLVVASVFTALLVSNIAYGFYMTRFYFS